MDSVKLILTSALVSSFVSVMAEDDSVKRKFNLGAYGEAVMTRNFYSDNIYRYKYPYEHKDDASHGRFDLPHMAINMGYDFGKGWSVGMEIEFEHGGTESAVEYEADESGEYEAEVEKGGEVALEQLWVNKAFKQGMFNIRAGEIVVPVGQANAYHMPNEFFTVYRHEGESSILPNTWHQVGLSFWGKTKYVNYEMQFLSGLDSERFGSENFVHYGCVSPYEFKIANSYAAATRVSVKPADGVRLSLSGYLGRTFKNTLAHPSAKYDDVKGRLGIGSLDFYVNRGAWIVRGGATYAHLGDAQTITEFNNTLPLHHGQDGSPSKHQPVGESALATSLELGWNMLSVVPKAEAKQKLYLFGAYEYYDSMLDGSQKESYNWCGKNRFAVGLNYMPVNGVIVKAEYSKRYLNDMDESAANANNTHVGHTDEPLGQYNDEPSISLGVTFVGWFIK